MRYFAIFVVFIFAALTVRAQATNPTIYSYKQKRLNDTLQMLFPDLETSKEIPYKEGMPVLALGNEGIKAGSNSIGDIYKMQTDQMPCLKPYKIKDETPNAIDQKQLMPKGAH